MVTRRLAPLVAAVAFLAPLSARAQQSVADSLWRVGQRGAAIEEYRRILAGDSNAVRANFRVAEALAGTNLDSALRFIRAARARVPDDPDLMFTEAKYLAWSQRFDAAIALYDSILAKHDDFDYVRVARARALSWAGRLDAARQGYEAVLRGKGADKDARRDAAFGRAQVSAWQGNLADAADQYASLLADDPTEVRVLVGLAAVRNYQGRPFAADSLLSRAIARDSADPDARLLKAAVAQSRAPTLEVSGSWSHDSDDNNVAWQTATQTFLVRDGTRVSARVGNQRAIDPIRKTSRLLAELSGSMNPGSFGLSASVGARQLNVNEAPPGSVADRTEFTWRAIASARPVPALGVGIAVERVPFDEIAALLARGINLTNVDANVDWRVRSATTLTLSGGTLGLSDGNRRNSGALRVSQRATSALTLGVLARTFSFAEKATGYFTP